MVEPRKSNTWMPLYVGSYVRNTMHLSVEQHGAYLLLLMHAWVKGGTIPLDDMQLSGIAKMTPEVWRKHKRVVLAFFERGPDGYTNPRVSEELGRAGEITEARRLAGLQGGRPKKQTESKPKANGYANQKQNETPLQLQSHTEIKDDKSSSLSAARERKAESPIPEDWPSADAIRLAQLRIAEAGVELNAAPQALFFRNHALTKDRRVCDWGAAWTGWVDIEIQKAPKAAIVTKLPAMLQWSGPPDVRAAAVEKMDEPWVITWLDPCRWRDLPDKAIVSASPTTVKRLTEELGDYLAELGIAIRLEAIA